tara:strand:- start:42548 stop:42874 length:327 start_codon:yes stop_codon:yes gene_type:complete
MTDKEEIDFAFNWIDEHEDDMGFLPANFLAFAKDFIEAQSKSQKSAIPCVINWVAFDWMKIETRPTKYGKYLITRKDGKRHWETWNGSGWAYNHNEIRYWAEIKPPCL